jgi:DNA-binding PadR family transcriptional regulator
MLGKSLSRLVQPTILTVLAASDKPLHGYLIVKEAANAPTFGGKKPDATGVYRTLKLMEENGLVTSEWDMPKAGPAKRAFTLTDSGRATLRRWIDSLACYELTVEEVRKEAAAALEIPLPNAPVCHD